MPASRSYEVTQERMVRVAAETPAEAIAVADKLFRGEKVEDVIIYTPARIIQTDAREERF